MPKQKQPADLMEESIIFAGADADVRQSMAEMNPIGDTVPPVVLDKSSWRRRYPHCG
ncbi:hypothetical protein [Klebsiella pneumoniae]|uniref:hypothetical protein n=1 Tax=Klebsiella pneumoniae TaxID=573 RepID=UPI001D0D939B|nr:hypothetical protein [Klebsiella pneumoniae]